MRTKWTKYRLREYKTDLSSFLTSWCKDFTLVLHSGARQQIRCIILHHGEKHPGSRLVFQPEDSTQKLPTQQPLYRHSFLSLRSMSNSKDLKFYKSASPDPDMHRWHIFISIIQSVMVSWMDPSAWMDAKQLLRFFFRWIVCPATSAEINSVDTTDGVLEKVPGHRFYKWENEIQSQLLIFHRAIIPQNKPGRYRMKNEASVPGLVPFKMS